MQQIKLEKFFAEMSDEASRMADARFELGRADLVSPMNNPISPADQRGELVPVREPLGRSERADPLQGDL